MTIEEFINELKDWNPADKFKKLVIPVRRRKNGEIKNPEVIGIVNIYSDSNESVVFEKKEGIKVEGKKEYVEYKARRCIKDDEWVKNAEIRRENLKSYLKKINPSRLFVGEAPGRRGCFWTGIPFTDELTISESLKSEDENAFFKKFEESDKEYEFRIINNSKPSREWPTSSTVWECLTKLNQDQLPLLWNIYPFQPWGYGKICKNGNRNKNNRPPEDIECQVGIGFLIKLLKCFFIKEIYSVGNKAKNTLNSKPALEALEKLKKTDEKYKNKNIELKIGHIRHPANGGKDDFTDGFNEIYGI